MTLVIVSLGSVNVDIQVRVERWPEPGESMLSHDFLMLGGGKAANVAILARKLGHAARAIARVGDDALGPIALAPMRDNGVDIEEVRSVPNCSTAVSTIFVRPDGQKTIVLSLNANDAWNAQDELRVCEVIDRASAPSVLVADLEIPVRVTRSALQRARARGVPTILDPSPAERLDDELMALADFMTPNASEAASMLGVPHPKGARDALELGRALIERGAVHACMKLDDGGCAMVSAHGSRCVLEPPPVSVVDSTGAGDAFAGGLAVAIAEGRSPEDAVRMAVATSSLAVTGYGSSPAYPHRAEADRICASVRVY